MQSCLGPAARRALVGALTLLAACARPAASTVPPDAPCPPCTEAAAPLDAGGPLLLRGVRVVDPRGACSVGAPTDVAIADGLVTEIGPGLEPPPGGRVIDEPELLVLPGFVDTHTHLWQHVGKGLASQSALQDWVKAIYALAPYLGTEDMRVLTEAAAREASLSGVTSVIDFTIDYHGGQLAGVAEGLRRSGVGGAFIVWKPGLFLPPDAADRYVQQLRATAGRDLELRVGFGPMSFYPVSTVNDGIDLGRRNEVRLTEHTSENLQEQRDLVASLQAYLAAHAGALRPDDRDLLASVVRSAQEISADPRLADARRLVDFSAGLDATARAALEGLGTNRWRTAVPILEQLGALDQPFVAIHSVWPSPEDLEIYAARGVIVSHNPESNMVLASGVAPISAYLRAGIPVSLGTDGAASNDRIQLFDAMRSAAALQKVRELDARAPTACEVLAMATRHGATALGRSDLGAVEVGMQADLVLMSRARLGLASAVSDERLLSGLVYSATARDIAHVISNGVVIVSHGALRGVDEGALAAEVSETVRAVTTRAREGAHYQRSWLEQGDAVPDPTWFSVRKLDRVEIELAADGAARQLELAFSGTTMGGNAPFTMAPASLERFPAATPPRFGHYALEVPAGATVSLRRAAGSRQWVIEAGGQTLEHEGAYAEQVMLRWAPARAETGPVSSRGHHPAPDDARRVARRSAQRPSPRTIARPGGSSGRP